MSAKTEHFFHKEDLVHTLDMCLNKTLGMVDCNNIFAKTKTNPKITGIAGDIIEQSVLGYPADNKQEPDLNIDGVKTELKTTGIRLSKKEKNKYEAKEPMSITAVSPDIIVTEVFEQSNFWHKLEHMLLVYYHYDSAKTVIAAEYANFPIKGYEFYEFDDEDRVTLKNDWTIVHDFLISLRENHTDYESEYPRLSSELRDRLLFIDTAPKWPNRPRFRLKRAVITNIVQNHFGDGLEQLPGKYTSYNDIDTKCCDLTIKYKGKTVQQLIDFFGIKGKINNKSIGEQIIVRMFDGASKKMQKIEFFNKIGLLGKTVVLTKKGLRTEDMKLFCIDFEEIMESDISFEDSAFRDFFANQQMMCIVFEEPNSQAGLNENKLLGFKRLFLTILLSKKKLNQFGKGFVN
ncbi:MAG: MutH/Sau3AI family endonuclease [Suipraeoptans sp.]